MPPRRALPSPPLQLITGEWRDAADLERRVAAALRGGVRWVQLRSKTRSAREMHDAAARLAPVVAEAGGLFVINDRVDIALAVGAGGVHLPEHGMDPRDARRLLGQSAWIARSVHSVERVATADAWDVDAIQIGPIFDTLSKRAFGLPVGLQTLRRAAIVAAAHDAALIAVGGIRGERVRECLAAGAYAVAVIGAIWDDGDVERAACDIVRASRVRPRSAASEK
jgi:thiamine-phosphate pyrophosphorylase